MKVIAVDKKTSNLIRVSVEISEIINMEHYRVGGLAQIIKDMPDSLALELFSDINNNIILEMIQDILYGEDDRSLLEDSRLFHITVHIVNVKKKKGLHSYSKLLHGGYQFVD